MPALYGKARVKDVPVLAVKAYGETYIQFDTFLTSMSASPSGKNTRYPQNRVSQFSFLPSLKCWSCAFRISMAKAAFNKIKTLFTSRLDLNLRKKLVKCYIWSIALYGAEKVYQKYLESFEVWCWRRREISWTDSVKNE
jgi:hypothetical protein